MMRSTQVGLLFGGLLGLALILEGFGDMLVVALFGALGWLAARVFEGDVDLNEIVASGRRAAGGSSARSRR